MTVTSVPGLRGTGAFTADYRPTNYRELYTFLEPNGDAPLQALLAMLGSESTDDPKFSNFRDELPTRSFIAAAGYASGVTTIGITVVADAGWLTEGTILVNAATGEVIRCTADGNTTAGTVTVTRNIGGTSYAITNADKLFVAGFAAEEGDDSVSSITFDPTVEYNYTQIFRKPFMLSETLRNTFLRTGPKEDEYTTKALKLHMEDIERAFFWSRRSESTGAGGQKLRTTGGLLTTLTNVIDAGTFSPANTMSEDAFDRKLIDSVFAYGSKTKVAYVGATIAGHLQKIGKNRWAPQQVDGTYGINFTRYSTFAGDLLVYLHPQFRQVPGMDNAMVVLDTDFMKYRFMANRDTQLRQNIQNNDVDAVKHEYLTECGLELLQDKVHTYVKGWTTLS